ncbi:MAG: cell division protein FtsW [Candidatus Taylorbacteria bacterium]|nr:cell division protein FtsW [Candidatus Taylorbacteria bacterium]
MKQNRMDIQLLISILLLVGAGFLIFLSASLGLLERDSGYMSSIVWKQIYLGLIPGLIALYAFSRLDVALWRKFSFWIFIGAIVLNVLVFIPGLGLSHGGATRWLLIGSFSLQVSEVLKIASVIYFASWLAYARERASEWKMGFLPLVAMLVIVSVLLLAQPDTDTLAIIGASLLAMYVSAGGKWKHVAILAVVGALCLAALAFTRPYVMSRIQTFLDPSASSQGAGYQIQQSLIAVGSGGLAGRGFGQSIQKFNYLPEPVGDSIFAVAAEEFGFFGSVALIALYVFFAMRSLRIAGAAENAYSGLLAVGITTFVIAQSFVNISAMLGVLPLSGIPLLFVSQGGTALFFVLAVSGMLLNISRKARIGRAM